MVGQGFSKVPQTPSFSRDAQYTSLGVCSQNGAAATRTSTYTLPLIDPDDLPALWDGDNLFRAFDGLDARFDSDETFQGTSVGYDTNTEIYGGTTEGVDGYGRWYDFANPIVINGEKQIALPSVCQGSATSCPN